jgi:hypothetical protein
MIPCYVGGRGKSAHASTKDFKVAEGYDKDWPDYRERRGGSMSKELSLTAFVLERDQAFRDEARAAIICYNEAGLGTGINSMQLLAEGKPLIGFFFVIRRRVANRVESRGLSSC